MNSPGPLPQFPEELERVLLRFEDAWEREGEDPQYFYSFSPDGYAVGLNIVMYAMTH